MGDPIEDIGLPLARLVAHADHYTGKVIRMNSNGVGEMVGTVAETPLEAP